MSEKFRGTEISTQDIQVAIDLVRNGVFGKYDNYSWTTYILCPRTQELWDFKPVIGSALERAGTDPKEIKWNTTAFQPQVLRLGFTVVKFRKENPRQLGIRGFSFEALQDQHVVLTPPSGDVIENGFAPDQPAVSPPGAEQPAGKTQTMTSRFIRNSEIAHKVREDSQGICDRCKERTFQTSAGDWYVEIHHKTWLSEGGKDVLDNLVALCPTCHRREHHGTDRIYW